MEALLIVSLPEGRVDTYKYKETYRPSALPVRLACMPCLYAFSWSCLAEPPQLAPIQLKYTSPRVGTETRPPRNSRHAKEWEGELVCRFNLWRKRQPIYPGAGALAGMLAEHETRL